VSVGFSIPVRVYYEDTDAGGVVYYANYLHYLERARTEWLRALGFGIDDLAVSERTIFAVRSVSIDYLRPARLDDLLEIGVQLEEHTRTSFQLSQEVRRESQALCHAQVRMVCLNADTFAPRRIPAAVIAKLEQWKKS
jgi:acyl-CoA thioester hydrolase